MRRRIQIATLVAGYWLIFADLPAQVNSDSLIAVYAEKMRTYLDKDNKASDIFSFTKEGIEIYAPETDTCKRKLEFKISWSEIENMKSLLYFYDPRIILPLLIAKKDTPSSQRKIDNLSIICSQKKRESASITIHRQLSAIKIAIDPGHISGDIETAKTEKKWVEMKNSNNPLIEGELTLSTALILKKKLEAQGATVMLTRNKPNMSAFGIDFKTWKDSLFVSSTVKSYQKGEISFEEKNYLLFKASNTEIFRRFFIHQDILERAKRINEFCPDLTIIIHYNVDETNMNWNNPTNKNFNMAFVGGAFKENEFSDPESRVEFLRLLLTDDIENSVIFSKYVVESLVHHTGVPAVLDTNAGYLNENCITTGVNGVFCRNLTLTRKVKGTLVYGESLYQDNVHEYKLLGNREIIADGIKTSKRVETVAEAYYLGILNYIKELRK